MNGRKHMQWQSLPANLFIDGFNLFKKCSHVAICVPRHQNLQCHFVWDSENKYPWAMSQYTFICMYKELKGDILNITPTNISTFTKDFKTVVAQQGRHKIISRLVCNKECCR